MCWRDQVFDCDEGEYSPNPSFAESSFLPKSMKTTMQFSRPKLMTQPEQKQTRIVIPVDLFEPTSARQH